MRKRAWYRYGLTVVVLLLFPWMGRAVTGPVILCDTPTVSFGQVDTSAVITNVFILRNVGDTTGILGLPRTACGCTTARLSQTMVGPGETVSLTVTFKASGQAGQQKQVIYIPSRDPAVRPIALFLEGFVSKSQAK
ncbi:MAG: DUF1573 domain-containing protein [Kiritimatiellaceae bacterium]|nr:DUF1573 domain-containing protein [Kiritimatiellaceae bacterium]